MTMERILTLARYAALERWGKFKEELERLPDNAFVQRDERKAWAELEAIERIMEEFGC